MAVGTLTLFEEFIGYLGTKKINLDADTIMFGIVNNTTVPTADFATPVWADFSANVHTTGATNPITLSGVDYTEAAGDAPFKANSFTVAQSGSATGATTCWGIIYSDTATNKEAIGFVELGSIDLTAGQLDVKFAGVAVGSPGTMFTVSG